MGLPVEVNNLMLGSLGGYTVGRSLRFRSSASAYLNRTPASAGNRKTWTWSGWVKRGRLATALTYLYRVDSTNTDRCEFDSSDRLMVQQNDTTIRVSTQVFRDPSAWYHIVIAMDTTQATANNRTRVYVNGSEITSWTTQTNNAQNTDGNINSTNNHKFFGAGNTSEAFDGFIAELNFIDGQALTPSSFGAYDTNGVWQPKKYGGTYGTNGFYLPFSDTTSTTTLVQDSSGNGNNWTANNISLTSGTTYDSMIDSPTNSASSSNYSTINALMQNASAATLSYANLRGTNGTTGASSSYVGTIGFNSSKWYFEVFVESIGANNMWIGITKNQNYRTVDAYKDSWCYNKNGQITDNSPTGSAYGATYTTNDVVGVAVDADSGSITFYKNGVSQGTAFSSLSMSGGVYTIGGADNSAIMVFNFGQRPFSYTPPSGFKALNTYNLPAPSIANGAQYMAATLYTGNGGTQTINNGTNTTIGTTFQPDFIWMKSRNNTYNHSLFDSVRGGTKDLYSSTTDAENTVSGGVNSFNSNGMTIQNDATFANINASSTTYVGWQWKGGGTAVTNNSGTITSTVSANTTAGFSVVTYTGNGASAATVGHGLGVAPQMILTKMRNSSIASWNCWHIGIPTTQVIYISNTNAATTPGGSINWNPTSTTFRVDPDNGYGTNASGVTQVAYCFTSVAGYSRFGSYTGNGSTDGPFVYLGFRPRFVMVKRTDSSDAGNAHWFMYDSSRNTYNSTTNWLAANLSNAEASTSNIDLLSNGFKWRDSGNAVNASGGTYIYACFGENPFNISRGR